jgi:membrane fusion protein (multidrug efflux system)
MALRKKLEVRRGRMLGVLFLGGILWGGVGWSWGQPLPRVFAAEAKLEAFSDRIEALGTLRANESVELSATVSERVVFLGFEDGDRVTEGQVLLKLSALEEEALLTEARANANEARQQYERSRQLAASGATAQAELDQARREYETAEARLVAIESRLANLVVTAPFDGIVGFRNISVGALVRPGDLITTLDDDSTMLLDFSVPSTFLPVLQIGGKITAETAGRTQDLFEGVIRSVSSRVDPVTRAVQVRAVLPNPERELKPGLLMMVRLEANPREAVMIPEGALLPVGQQNFVMVLRPEGEDFVTERREVRLGGRRPGVVEIIEGVSAGELVVTDGAFKVGSGAKVDLVAKSDGTRTLAEKLEQGEAR